MIIQLATPYSDPSQKSNRAGSNAAHSKSYYDDVAADQYARKMQHKEGFEAWDEEVDEETAAIEAEMDEEEVIAEMVWN
jgi:hypothetical protein